MKRIFNSILTFILVFTVVLGICGCNFSTETDDEKDKIKVEENKDAEIYLNVAVLGKETEKNLMAQWINAYQKKNPKVGFKNPRSMSAMSDIVTFGSGTDNKPDIIWTAGDQHTFYSSQGYFLDLSDETKFKGSKEFFSGFYPSLMDSTHYSSSDEGIWFVPRDYNRLVVYYNKTAFIQAGVAEPQSGWTWTDFIATCSALKTANVKKAVEWPNWEPLNTTMLYNFGGKVFTQDGKIALESNETKACYNYLDKFYEDYTIEGKGASFKIYSGGGSLIQSTVPMIVDVRPQLTSYIQAARDANWELGAVSFPNFKQPDNGNGFVGTGCSGYAITKYCTDKAKIEAAWGFLKWCMSEEGYNEVAGLGNIVPALTSMRGSGDWIDYSYGGLSVDSAAFTAADTNDLFLNYFTPIDARIHENVIAGYAMFWNNLRDGKSYSAAIDKFKTNLSSII